MTAAKTPAIPNYTDPAQTGSIYPNNLDQAIAANQIISNQFQPHETLTGSPQTQDMSITIEAGTIFNGSTYISKAQQITSLSPADFIAPVTNPRVDRVAIDMDTGTYVVITGTEGASPAAPAYSSNHHPLCQVNFATVSPVITKITNDMITDERPLIKKETSILGKTTISGASVTTMEVTGLDSTYTNGYRVEAFIDSDGTSSLDLVINSDATAGNYTSDQAGLDATYGFSSATQNTLSSMGAGQEIFLTMDIIQEPTSGTVHISTRTNRPGVDINIVSTKYTVTDNITAIGVSRSSAGIGVGSFITVSRTI